MAKHRIEIPEWVALASTVRGSKDPVMIGPSEVRWNTRTPDGLGSLHLDRVDAATVEVEAFGPGADWMIAQAPRLLGADDDPSGFDPPRGPLGDRWRRAPFLLGRTDRLWDALVGGVLGQKVQAKNAYASRRRIARRFGNEAPGPDGGWILPSPERFAELGYSDLHPGGVERKRAEILLRVSREMPRIEGITNRTPAQVQARIQQIRGIGPWTAAMVTASAMGDADAVPVGDYHIPNTIAWHLAGEERGTDDRMQELLEPWAGHRWRVIRLAKASGGAPKRGPKLSLTGDGLHQERLARPPAWRP
ncbi:MAG: DNA-3-methyladenine glycosylase family protein [Acidimicrobiales bacterium]